MFTENYLIVRNPSGIFCFILTRSTDHMLQRFLLLFPSLTTEITLVCAVLKAFVLTGITSNILEELQRKPNVAAWLEYNSI